MPQISVIIPNYNGMKYIENCLDSVLAQTLGTQLEIIVVDNASEDGSNLVIMDRYPSVKLVVLDQNYGFSRAVNEGLKRASAPYVLLLNNDIVADKYLAEELLTTIKKDSAIFSVASRMLQLHERDKIDGAGDLYSAFGWAFARGKGMPADKVKYMKEMDVFSACAGAALYSKRILDEIGYFDEFHFAYLEDLDIGYRAKIMGYRNVYCPTAVVYHAGSATTGSRYNEFKVRLSARNNVYVVFKNMPVLQIVLNLPFLLIGFGIKALFFAMKGLGRPYLSGIKRGYILCHEGRRIHYDKRNFKNYVRIQLELWSGMFKRLVN